MSKFEFFVSQDKFSRTAQISLKFAYVKHNWKFKNLEMLFKNSWKIGMPFGRRSWKIGTSSGTLTHQVEKLACLWLVGMPSWIISTSLACWYVYWHVVM